MKSAIPVTLALLGGLWLSAHSVEVHGMAYSRDSASYASAANGLAAGQGLLDYDGAPFRHWPPLYPVLLAFGPALGSTVTAAAGALNVIALGGVIILAGAWMTRHEVHAGLAGAAALAMVVTGPLHLVSVHVWSEPVLLALTLVVALIIPLAAAGRPRALAALALIGALAGLQRYAGLAVTLAACLALWLTREPALPRRWIAYVAMAGVLPGLLWLARHHPERPPPAFSFKQQVAVGLTTVGGWAFGADLGDRSRGILGLVVLAGLGALFTRRGAPRGSSTVYLAVLVPVYVATLAGAATGIVIDRVDDRLLSPIFAPLVLLAMLLTDRAGAQLEARAPRTRALLAGGLALLLIPAAWRANGRAQAWHERGVPGTLRDAVAAAHPILEPLKHLPDAFHAYSDAPWSFYVWTGRRAAIPPRGDDEALRFARNLVSNRPTFLFWFGSPASITMGALPELAPRIVSRWIWTGPQGAIIQLGLRPPPK